MQKFILHCPGQLIFIVLTLEKTNTWCLSTEWFLLRNVPSSQDRSRETLSSPACLLCPSGEPPCMLPTVALVLGRQQTPGNCPLWPPAAISIRGTDGKVPQVWMGRGERGEVTTWNSTGGDPCWFRGRRRRGEGVACHSTAMAGICSHLSLGGTSQCESSALEANACLRETSLTDILHK